MTIWRAAYVFVRRGVVLEKPQPAFLDPDEIDYLQRHIDRLREKADDADALFSRFQRGSSIHSMLRALSRGDEPALLDSTGVIAERLLAQMSGTAASRPGILAVVTSGGTSEAAEHVSVLKLDATTEAANWHRQGQRIRLSVMKHLLPAPGDLQKGISLPDPRTGSHAIVRDRNIDAARYFLNACDLRVSPKALDTAKQLVDAVAKLPEEQVPKAWAAVAAESGPANEVVARLRQTYPELEDRPAFGTGENIAGVVRPEKVAARPLTLRADGFVIRVPSTRTDKLSFDREGDHWLIRIEVDAKPTWGS